MNRASAGPSAALTLTQVLLCGAAIVLGLVFMAYRSPHLAVDLANRVWACF